MQNLSFIKYLLLTSGVSVLLVLIFNLIIDISGYYDFTLGSLLFFAGLSFFIFLMARRGAGSRAGEFFLYIIVVNVFIKLIASFAIIFIYAKTAQPQDKFFVVPFLIVYLVFTIFETWFLSKMAKG